MHPHVTLTPRRLAATLGAALVTGAAGTLIRYWLTGLEHLPSSSSRAATWAQLIPWWLLVVNALGALLAAFALWGPLRHRDPNDLPRVIVVAGFFGGLTSYSSLYEDLGHVWHLSAVGGLIVTVGALLSGALAAVAGIRWADRRSRR